MHSILKTKRLIPAYLFFTLYSLFIFFNPPISNAEYYSGSINPKCNLEVGNSNQIDKCYVKNVREYHISNPSVYDNKTVTKTAVKETTNFNISQEYEILKSQVKAESFPVEKYYNVGEPSFGSNGEIVFYTGNHYAARSINAKNWQFVDPYFDFRGMKVDVQGNSTGKLMDLFWADQRVHYDSKHDIFIWLRQGEKHIQSTPFSYTVTNIDRLGISMDAINWTMYDFSPRDIFQRFGAKDRVLFDYPEIVLDDKYLYFTTSTIDLRTNQQYGSIIRFLLNDLGNNTKVRYEAQLDGNVNSITPVEGDSNLQYFGTHLKNDTSKMKIYSWDDDSNSTQEWIVNISPWNDIHNNEYCTPNSDLWWCKSHTSSKIRSAWSYDNTINFLWNAVVTYDDGQNWHPYIDVATFNTDRDMKYEERRYQVADRSTQWIFGAITPDHNNRLGLIAFYANTNYTNPRFNLAFGIFNQITNMWDLDTLISSSANLPVLNKTDNDNYDWGDFLTIRNHIGSLKDGYSWDAGGYILTGKRYHDIEPYFIMIK